MIVAAAILFNGSIYALPAPARHHDIIHYMVENLDIERVPGSATQGFIDSEVGFVGRRVARNIAWMDGQIDWDTTTHPTELFSEDLW